MKISHVVLAVCVIGALAAIPMVTRTFFAAPDGDLGDLSAMRVIVVETQNLVARSDLAAAKARITDFETAWDAAERDLRNRSDRKWNAVDEAADEALDAIRSDAAPEVSRAALSSLLAQLDNPGPVANGSAVARNSNRPVPCEDLLRQLRTAKAKTPLDDARRAKLAELESKGIERCNADDDAHADVSFREALKLMGL